MLAKTASLVESNTNCQKLYQQLLYATRIDPEVTRYTSESLLAVFSGKDELESHLMLLAYMFALLTPGMAYDYALKSQSEAFLREYDTYFPHLYPLKPLLAKLNTIKHIKNICLFYGITPHYLLGYVENLDEYLSVDESGNVECKQDGTPKIYHQGMTFDPAYIISCREEYENLAITDVQLYSLINKLLLSDDQHKQLCKHFLTALFNFNDPQN